MFTRFDLRCKYAFSIKFIFTLYREGNREKKSLRPHNIMYLPCTYYMEVQCAAYEYRITLFCFEHYDDDDIMIPTYYSIPTRLKKEKKMVRKH
jgi:hypothetical protein